MSYVPEMRVYALHHMIDNDFVTAFLDTRREVLNWYMAMPGLIMVVSRSDLLALTGIIHAGLPWMHFVLNEIHPESVNGFIGRGVWDFINNPQSSGRWE